MGAAEPREQLQRLRLGQSHRAPSGSEVCETPGELIRVAQDVGCGGPEGLHSDGRRECSPRGQNRLNPNTGSPERRVSTAWLPALGRLPLAQRATLARVLPPRLIALAKKSQNSGALRPFLPSFLPTFLSRASDEPWPEGPPACSGCLLLDLSRASPITTNPVPSRKT